MACRILINYTPEFRVVNKAELLKIIKEEIEVVLTNAEAVEFFDLDPAALLDEVISEADGKDCADTEKGCIRQRDGQWVILNNKKGGIWRKCDSRAHCEEILDAFHASKG